MLAYLMTDIAWYRMAQYELVCQIESGDYSQAGLCELL